MIKKRMTWGILCLLSLLWSAAVAQEQMYTLKRMPKEGEVVKYRSTITGHAGEVDVEMAFVIQEKITKVEPGGDYWVERSTLEGKYVLDKQESPAPKEALGTPQIIRYQPNGNLGAQADQSKGSPETYAMNQIELFISPEKPVKIGDAWAHTWKADPLSGLRAATIHYSMEGIEKIGNIETARIRFIFKEDTASSPLIHLGGMWINLKDGGIVKVSSTVSHAPPFARVGMTIVRYLRETM